MHVSATSDDYLISIGIPAMPNSAPVTDDDTTRLLNLNQLSQFWSVLITHVRDESPERTAQWRDHTEASPESRKAYMSVYKKQLASNTCFDKRNIAY